ncbi:hypothetical protein INR49_012311 [Caranx melampygus]|nr:hypothetical protein INR49_012311 [Caranx melampygus]
MPALLSNIFVISDLTIRCCFLSLLSWRPTLFFYAPCPPPSKRARDMEEQRRVNGFGQNPERRSSDWGHITLLDKTKEFFQTCDVEGKGFITRTDMRRLHRELPLSAEELEDVFDSLDTARTGYLTLEAFSSGFSQFLHGRRISVTDDQNQTPSPILRTKEAFYQCQWEAKLSAVEDEEERHFCMLLESLGASNVFEE